MSNEKPIIPPQPTPKRDIPVPSKPERPQPNKEPDRRIGPDVIPEHLEPSKPWPRKG
ncbi:MAG: hypothetical protein HYS21_00040 [Deltaproteobacteria bacterium]|nr:hypothetical protein [Deltaproteobacteria bacterium]